MISVGSPKKLSLRVPIEDHGFLDFCFYVIRNHQLHVSMKYNEKIKERNEVRNVNVNEVCDVNVNEVCNNVVPKKEFHVSLMDSSDLCKCLEKLVSRGNLCFENLEDFMYEENKNEHVAMAAVTQSKNLPAIREKFDSAASSNFYGNRDCLKVVSSRSDPIRIAGFTENHQAVSSERGMNIDDKEAFYVKGMPTDLALLSAYLYVQDGAALLLPSEGVVVKLSPEEREELKEFIKGFQEVFKLKVVNNTYEVVRSTTTPPLEMTDERLIENEAMSLGDTKLTQ